MTYRVAELVADSLVAHGIDRAFSVPGESFLALLDALRDRSDFDLVTCRHEGSASLAAVADAKLTGRAGVVMASRGPGAFNAALGLHVAAQEAIPLVMLVGQVDRPNLARDAVQEIDCGRSFDGVLKWSVRLNSTDLVPEMMARAFAVACAGTPGPVAVELPEDLLEEAAEGHAVRANGLACPEPGSAAIEKAAAALTAAERPILLVGGECRTASFREDLVAFSEKWNVPVVTMNKMQDQFPNAHPLWAGQFGFFPSQPHAKLLERADLVVAVGTRLGDLSSLGFAFPRHAEPRQPLVHVYPDPDAIGKRVMADVAVVSGSHAFVSALLTVSAASPDRTEWLRAAAAVRLATHGWPRFGVPSADVFGHAVAAIATHFKPDGIVTTDSGNFAGWVHRIFSLGPTARLLGSACGAMGSGVPSGLAASLRFPGRQVVAFCGDGGFLMTGNELATAVARQANLKIVISNNRSYGTIRSHQERAFPDRPYGTDLSNPDFAALARAFGAKGFIVEDTESAPSTIAEAMTAEGPVVIEVRSDVRQTLEKSLAASRRDTSN
ncbi:MULTISPECIES: thiamine pyrophosphate-dependent enzyme [unclassified Bradyrhizobium]|uniref:thiamine pyrophosphate-dependent enzyme n=1 Tax=unclassified Bradyrhizobium TaxID=2631580 RepID=UPI001FF79BA5|nr:MULTISPECIES: thiamine pyrophosphate-dependent enzyme [unclassified Bradyrhizobium]MCK1298421.1 decarboxylase [Bradyrhizobium sp. 37]MCK1769464.1 decarboxylase [Bradyrhizobium sp. 134]